VANGSIEEGSRMKPNDIEEGSRMKPNDIETGDKAYELAEWAYTHMPVQELLDKYTHQWEDNDPIDTALRKAWFNVLLEYTSLPVEQINRLYDDMTGVPTT
jgi:hypothetical protein